MRSLVTDATPYKQGLRESLDFGSFLSANRTPNVRVGSSTVLQHPSGQRLECGDEPTFGSGGRQWDGERTLRRGEAKVGFVPGAAIRGRT